MAENAKREQEALVVKRTPLVKSIDTVNDKITIELDYNGIIDMKEGGKAHTVAYLTHTVPRSDGKVLTVTAMAYYKDAK